MNLLLDSCVLIWLSSSPRRISRAAQRAIDHLENQLCLSHASIWEIELKHHAGKLDLPESPRLWFARQLTEWAIRDIAIEIDHLHLTSELPPVHKDPFDRLLVAQARIQGLTLVSPDAFFPDYGIDVIW